MKHKESIGASPPQLRQLQPTTLTEWLTGDQVLQSLKISKRTLQAWRDSGKIGFSKIGRKIYYKASDISQLLATNYSQAF